MRAEENKEMEAKKKSYGQWKLMWLALKKHRLAMAGGIILLIFYTGILFAEFIAPYDPRARNTDFTFSPPSKIHIMSEEGRLHMPFVYELESRLNKSTFRKEYREMKEGKKYKIRVFVKGHEYKLLGIVNCNIHLFGTEEGGKIFLFGTDMQGRCVFSRIVYGTRVSLTIGLAGVIISFFFAIVLGTISGYFGGTADMIIQRSIVILTSIPTIPLYMALAAAIPLNWPVTKVFFVITVILSLVGWPRLARVVRGKILQIKNADYFKAASLDNAGFPRLLFLYCIPGILSHLIAALTLAIPAMILGETALGFLGIGLRPPAISWGVLLQDAQNIQAVTLNPWLLLTVIPIIISTLAFNFLGDGLRDAADPYR